MNEKNISCSNCQYSLKTSYGNICTALPIDNSNKRVIPTSLYNLYKCIYYRSNRDKNILNE